MTPSYPKTYNQVYQALSRSEISQTNPFLSANWLNLTRLGGSEKNFRKYLGPMILCLNSLLSQMLVKYLGWFLIEPGDVSLTTKTNIRTGLGPEDPV